MEWLVNIILAAVLSLFGIGSCGEVAPDWCGTELHFGTAECGACGEELHAWRTVRDYADTEDVPVCGECWECFAEDTEANRAAMHDGFWGDAERVGYYIG